MGIVHYDQPICTDVNKFEIAIRKKEMQKCLEKYKK